MNEEKISQILNNQQAIMSALFSQFYGNKEGKLTQEFLIECMFETPRFLNLKLKDAEPTLQEKTKDALQEGEE